MNCDLPLTNLEQISHKMKCNIGGCIFTLLQCCNASHCPNGNITIAEISFYNPGPDSTVMRMLILTSGIPSNLFPRSILQYASIAIASLLFTQCNNNKQNSPFLLLYIMIICKITYFLLVVCTDATLQCVAIINY